MGVLLEAADEGEDVSLGAVWAAIDNVVPRSELRAAVANLAATLPPPDVDADGGWRAVLVERYVVVRQFVPLLCRTIEFEATAEAARVLEAFRQLPMLLEARATKRVPAGYLDADVAPLDVVPAGWWRQLVFSPEPILNSLQLPAEPNALLDDHALHLDEVWRQVAGRLDTDGGFSIDRDGRLHAPSVDAIADPPSLTDLRGRCEAMLPRV